MRVHMRVCTVSVCVRECHEEGSIGAGPGSRMTFCQTGSGHRNFAEAVLLL